MSLIQEKPVIHCSTVETLGSVMVLYSEDDNTRIRISTYPESFANDIRMLLNTPTYRLSETVKSFLKNLL